MQRAILSKKNQITVISGILLITALFGHLVLKSEEIVLPSLIIASILGAAPIAIQAYQALRVKVVSIDCLLYTSSRCPRGHPNYFRNNQAG